MAKIPKDYKLLSKEEIEGMLRKDTEAIWWDGYYRAVRDIIDKLGEDFIDDGNIPNDMPKV